MLSFQGMKTSTKQSAKKLWGGRFSQQTSSLVEQFTQSVSFDQRLARYDVAGSIAHAEMLRKIGLLSKAEAAKIISGLKAIGRDIATGTFVFREELEDVHMNIEAELTRRIGPAAQKLHTGRSRNDQVALDERLYLRDILAQVGTEVAAVQRALVDLATRNKALIMPGFTHLQHAMPVLVAHHLLAYVEMFERDKSRLADAAKRANVMPLGSAAMAGTGFALDRAFVARRLGFAGVTSNSMDSVADRDCLVEFLSCAAMLGMHLSRLAEDFVLWMSPEFGFIDIGDAFCTGSSIMPNKKNPDVLELLRGKCGRLYGNLIALLTVMKGLPMTYNRDMQEDKEPVFNSADTLLAALKTLAAMLRTVTFKPARLAAASDDAFLLATDWADYLVTHGVPFRRAHELVGKAVALSIGRKCRLTGLNAADLRAISGEFDPGVLGIRTAAQSVNAKKTVGSTNPRAVERELAKWAGLLAAQPGRRPGTK